MNHATKYGFCTPTRDLGPIYDVYPLIGQVRSFERTKFV